MCSIPSRCRARLKAVGFVLSTAPPLFGVNAVKERPMCSLVGLTRGGSLARKLGPRKPRRE